MLKSKLKSTKINSQKISVYGLGNVGGPIAAAWIKAGYIVIGVDTSKKLLAEIKKGISHKKEPFISTIFLNAIKKNKLYLTSNGVEASKQSDIKIVAVPVALKKNKINLENLTAAVTDISYGLKKRDAVIICPSIPPGTTEKIILPLLEKNSKLKAERDFYLIYNPERIYEGRALQDIEENYPAIVAGLGSKSLKFAEKLMNLISKKGVIALSTIAIAEAEKLFEGVYRDVNIALANELANFCEGAGVDYWEARNAANSQPFCHLHYPGTGVGGLCIPVYPRFIIETASNLGKSVDMIEFARKINDFMPKKCVKDAIKLLIKNKIPIKGTKIAVLGLGFRGEVTDSRLSPTYTVVNEFLKKGYKVEVHDPYILGDNSLPESVKLSNDLNAVVADASLIFISTEHKKYSKLTKKNFIKAKKSLLIFDGRNILNKNKFNHNRLMTIGIGIR
ncbi:MAG: nucleotide sugar dehydrogenase [Nitrosopumilaceae archaeon]